MKYHFKVHKEGEGFWAECLELPGCITEGDSKEELFENMKDALNTFLEEPEATQNLSPLPDPSIRSSRNVIEVPVDPSIAFALLIRYERIEHGLTQKQAAKLLGMKDLYSYQRLERKCNPTLSLIVRVALVYPNLSLDKIIR